MPPIPDARTAEPSGPGLLRRLRLLRLSVTDLCNFRCRYCMPPEGVPKRRHGDLLSLEELAELAAWLALHSNIDRIRLTGGEPLLRSGLDRLIVSLSSLPSIREISLTTNGSLLSRSAWTLKAAGLARVNVSLDSLDGERFARLTGGGQLQQALDGIDAARRADLRPIKLNTVLRRSTWRQDVPLLLDYAAENGFEIRFIELMRTGTDPAWCSSEFVAADRVRRELGDRFLALPGGRSGAEPALRTSLAWRGREVAVGWIAPRSHPFCGRCERLRLNARGQLHRCLMDPEIFDLAAVMRSHGPAAALDAVVSYLAGKAPPGRMDSPLPMSRVGG